MSVTLTCVSVSLTRCTLNGATILSDDEPGNQDVDYKDKLHNDFFLLQITYEYVSILNKSTRL